METIRLEGTATVTPNRAEVPASPQARVGDRVVVATQRVHAERDDGFVRVDWIGLWDGIILAGFSSHASHAAASTATRWLQRDGTYAKGKHQ